MNLEKLDMRKKKKKKKAKAHLIEQVKDKRPSFLYLSMLEYYNKFKIKEYIGSK